MRTSYWTYCFIFIFVIITVVMTGNITYADPVLSQSSEDIPSSWAKEGIDEAIAAALVPQELQGEYKQNITREEFCEIAVSLYEALSGKEAIAKGNNPFTDTQNIKVIVAYDLGIVKGVSSSKFAPDNAITRQEISVMLYRALRVAKPENSYTGSYNHVFADDAMIAAWAKEAVGYLYGIEVINGVGYNRFSPRTNTSREQAIVLAARLHKNALTTTNNLVVSRSGTSRQEDVMQSKLAALISQEMGKPYQWGAEGPDRYDCSGLTYYVYGKLGISLPRISRDQAKVGVYVAKDELIYGDLVFFARDGKTVNHVGIYVGDGLMVHAPQTGDVVKKSTIMSGYYNTYYYTARRIIR